MYKPGSSADNKLHYRPLEIDLWYPAVSTGSEPVIEYGEFLQLLQQRSNRFQDDTVYKSMTTELLQYLCSGLGIADTFKLGHLKTVSYRNAKPVAQQFPLIIYMCSFNGMSYENIRLLENLAEHGYVVAGVTSVGRYPGNMSTDPADLLEQERDGLYTIEELKKKDNVAPGNVGVIGYSWGGLAGLLLAMNTDKVSAILSLDGSEMHYYGESVEEDEDFNQLRASRYFNLKNIHVPYTYLASGDKASGREVDSIYNILAAQKQYIHFPGTEHEDFSYFPALGAQLATTKRNGVEVRQLEAFPLCYFDRWLKGETGALSAWLTETWEQHSADSILTPSNSKGLVITGKVVDHKNDTALAYVNVGVPGKNTGTVTQYDGRFTFAIDTTMYEDSIRLSMAGYEPVTIAIKHLLKQRRPITIRMDEKIAELKEVVVVAKSPVIKRLGNTTTSRSVSVGFPMRFLGAELGIRIKLGRRVTRLKSFNFNVSYSRMDSAVFRLNIYAFDKGVPSANILKTNILVPIGKRAGAYSIDLSRYGLALEGDVLVSLELLNVPSNNPTAGALFLSAGFFNSATWRRTTSEAVWKRAGGIGVGFNLGVY